MTTSRGITDTRVYDREGVIERYGIPPELVPGLHRAEGRHLRQHPGRPGHRRQDRRPAAAAVRVARGGARAHRRDLRREAAREPARERRPGADLQGARDPPARHRRRRRRDRDRGSAAPDRSRLREVFTRFELRDPLRRLEEALGEEEAAPRAAGERRVEATLREAHAGRDRASWAMRPALAGRREDGEALRWAAHAAARCWSARRRRSPSCSRPGATRPLVAHDWKALRRDAGDGAAAGRDASRLATRHDGGRVPDRPRAPALSARRADRGGGHRAGRRGRRRDGARREARSRCARWPRAARGRSTSSELRRLLERGRAAAGRGALPARARRA